MPQEKPESHLAILILTAACAAMVVHIGIENYRRNVAVAAECAKNPAAHIVTDRTYPGSPVKRCVVGFSRWDGVTSDIE